MSNKCAAYGCSSIYDSERKYIKMKKVKTFQSVTALDNHKTLRYFSVIRVQATRAPMILGTCAPMIRLLNGEKCWAIHIVRMHKLLCFSTHSLIPPPVRLLNGENC